MNSLSPSKEPSVGDVHLDNNNQVQSQIALENRAHQEASLHSLEEIIDGRQSPVIDNAKSASPSPSDFPTGLDACPVARERNGKREKQQSENTALFSADTEQVLSSSNNNMTVYNVYDELRLHLDTIKKSRDSAGDAKVRYMHYIHTFYTTVEVMMADYIEESKGIDYPKLIRLCVHHIHSVDFSLPQDQLFQSIQKLCLVDDGEEQLANGVLQVFLIEKYPKSQRHSCFNMGNLFIMPSVSHTKELLTEVPVHVYMSYGLGKPYSYSPATSIASLISIDCDFSGCETMEEVRQWKMQCLHLPRSWNHVEKVRQDFEMSNSRNGAFNHYVVIKVNLSIGSRIGSAVTFAGRCIRQGLISIVTNGQQMLHSYYEQQ